MRSIFPSVGCYAIAKDRINGSLPKKIWTAILWKKSAIAK